MGPERRSRVITQHEKEITAYHESGHALVAHMLPHTDPVHKVSIVARGIAGGWTKTLPTEDRMYLSRAQLNSQIAMFLGGRAAEEMQFGDVTTGAQSDLQRATQLARRMVTEFGMSEKLGPRTFGQRHEMVFLGKEISEQRDYSDHLAEEIDEEVDSLIQTGFVLAKNILQQNASKLKEMAVQLIETETLAEEDLTRILGPRAAESAAV
jgi:cell division protease FtsH